MISFLLISLRRRTSPPAQSASACSNDISEPRSHRAAGAACARRAGAAVPASAARTVPRIARAPGNAGRVSARAGAGARACAAAEVVSRHRARAGAGSGAAARPAPRPRGGVSARGARHRKAAVCCSAPREAGQARVLPGCDRPQSGAGRGRDHDGRSASRSSARGRAWWCSRRGRWGWRYWRCSGGGDGGEQQQRGKAGTGHWGRRWVRRTELRLWTGRGRGLSGRWRRSRRGWRCGRRWTRW